jgi:scavenger receptor class B, member 1
MHTGKDDISKLGVLSHWKFSENVDIFRGECDKVRGTTGELWPPIKSGKPSISVFATDICRSVTVQYDSDYSKYGINGYKWVADDKVFDNGKKYPEMSCYCTSNVESCPDLLAGVFNASACKFGAPAFVSFPHFYLADKSYRSDIEGMNPNKEDHEFYVSMEPQTGIPLDIRAQLQINLLMQNYPWTTINNVPEIMVPMLWFRQRAELSEELAKSARIATILPNLGAWTAYGFTSVGVLLLGLLSYCWFFRWRVVTNDDDEELLD